MVELLNHPSFFPVLEIEQEALLHEFIGLWPAPFLMVSEAIKELAIPAFLKPPNSPKARIWAISGTDNAHLGKHRIPISMACFGCKVAITAQNGQSQKMRFW